ncbi:MAG TPA: CRISPR-associated helicase Cas3' [Elusimicrobiales bacterium]|mgnify:CR=1 FL=1|nr:CRISPR-associated helicase Cas3' [Elusimicrobiales bacterium]
MREPGNQKNLEFKPKKIENCYAKSYEINGEKKFVDILTHSVITGQVAGKLKNFFTEELKNKILNDNIDIISSLHDIGKANPYFQNKIEFGTKTDIEPPHNEITEATLKKSFPKIAKILGKHHGYPPNEIFSPEADVYGGKEWNEIRLKILIKLENKFNKKLSDIDNEIKINVLAGLVTVSDWIASGIEFEHIKEYERHIEELVNKAGFIKPIIKKGLTFKDIFEFGPNEIQKNVIEKINDFSECVIEAPMGIGKTETALYLAYKALERDEANGIYFALPTQLTSEKIFERFELFLNKILAPEYKFKPKILHSNSWLKETHISEEGSPGHSWFDYRKRGLLAPFAVGTIDQALMSVLNVKHNFVRSFGLLGKVVIIDEVHSYDIYTGTLVKELVKNLKEMGSKIIILSATLREKEKKELVTNSKINKLPSSYPLITHTDEENVGFIQIKNNEQKEITIKFTDIEEQAIDICLEKLEQGNQVLWIENSVEEAQAFYKKINSRINKQTMECGLLHSRFTKIDRMEKEEKWLKYFDKKSGESGYRNNKSRLLIGTQVLEQSLDIDADFLITKIAPTDMLLQRIGRLWRHGQNDKFRPEKSMPEVLIITPELKEIFKKPEILGNTRKVYSKYVICRTLEVWGNLEKITLPNDIRNLIEKTYEERSELDMMERFKKELKEKSEKLRRFALINSSEGLKSQYDNEKKVLTRFSEFDNADVLLIKTIFFNKEEVKITFLNGETITLTKNKDIKNKKEIAIKILQNMLSVSEYISPKPEKSDYIKKDILKDYIFLDEDGIRIAIVDETGELKSVSGDKISESYNLIYNKNIGYYAQKARDYGK